MLYYSKKKKVDEMRINKIDKKQSRRIYKREAIANRTVEEIILYNRFQRSKLDNRIDKSKLLRVIRDTKKELALVRSERTIYAFGMVIFAVMCLIIEKLGGHLF